jgi:hypothetical protein
MRKQDKIAVVIILFIGILSVLFLVYRNKQLKSDGVIVYGTIIGHGHSAKSPVLEFKYSFAYEGKIHESWSDARVDYSSDFIGKTFPVKYSPKLGSGEMLITPRDFAKYGLLFPDSLKWVLPYLK